MKKWNRIPPEILKVRIDLDKENQLDLTFTKEDIDETILTLKCTEDFVYNMRIYLGNKGIKTEIIEP